MSASRVTVAAAREREREALAEAAEARAAMLDALHAGDESGARDAAFRAACAMADARKWRGVAEAAGWTRGR